MFAMLKQYKDSSESIKFIGHHLYKVVNHRFFALLHIRLQLTLWFFVSLGLDLYS